MVTRPSVWSYQELQTFRRCDATTRQMCSASDLELACRRFDPPVVVTVLSYKSKYIKQIMPTRKLGELMKVYNVCL